MIDFVFKILFGSVENIELLLDFLNKTLQPTEPLTSVEILNPYNEREYASDKLSIVDVRAKDKGGLELSFIHEATSLSTSMSPPQG
jgi:predicted transposase/invertase (TIGR01784 family)